MAIVCLRGVGWVSHISSLTHVTRVSGQLVMLLGLTHFLLKFLDYLNQDLRIFS